MSPQINSKHACLPRGSHWHQEILHRLLAGSPEFVRKSEAKEFLDFSPKDELLPPDHPRVLFTHVRDVSCLVWLKDPLGQIQKLDRFLGLNRGRELCERIAEACKFSNMKAVKEAHMPSEMKRKIWKENAPGFYRKGA
ncbi:hypothetical protein C0Q70_06771 [Pomacea canaliculata]|uniref:Sulfotransferase domain-containing protein n=1 Tax=Pomacea canaliculata TaxID=400727 RepID=A0A2T7PD70_POMCA|nr:hypothetical protein C0Q70_06771 [Pomacea canaliculata]